MSIYIWTNLSFKVESLDVSPLTFFVLNQCHMYGRRLPTADGKLEATGWPPFTLPDWLSSRTLLLFERFQRGRHCHYHQDLLHLLPLSYLLHCFGFRTKLLNFQRSRRRPPSRRHRHASARGQPILFERARSNTQTHTSCSDGVKD